MWRTVLTQNVIKKVNCNFTGASYPYNSKERIQINGRQMAQMEKKASAPGLPEFIIVDFGTEYRGPNFFLCYPNRSGWVPIRPITDQWYTKPTKVGGDCE